MVVPTWPPKVWSHGTQLADLCIDDRTVACVIRFKITNGQYQLLSIKCDYPIERYNIVYQLHRIK